MYIMMNIFNNQKAATMNQQDLYTVPPNLERLPASFHLIAPVFFESRLLQVSHQYQLRSDFYKQKPKVVL